MALALNNLKRVDMPLNKKTRPNQNQSDLERQLFYWFKKKHSSPQKAVNLRIKVEFESIPVPFPSFIPFQPE